MTEKSNEIKTYHLKQGENGLYTFRIGTDSAAIRYRYRKGSKFIDNKSVMDLATARQIYKAIIETGGKVVK